MVLALAFSAGTPTQRPKSSSSTAQISTKPASIRDAEVAEFLADVAFGQRRVGADGDKTVTNHPKKSPSPEDARHGICRLSQPDRN
jgi:hypothetical protein